ncbi:MAG: hypothetical protein JXB14_00730 [Candidatus Altiarchaeota archaeon]|nr:hypothetical protein [Candidatus Altiarchaeota archaeon]
MPKLKGRHRGALYKAIAEAQGGQIARGWERRLYKKMLGNMEVVPAKEARRGGGFVKEGEHISQVLVDNRGRRYIGRTRIVVPAETLKRLELLNSRRASERLKGEEALNTVSHEFAHNYFEAINYEARLTRYYMDHPRDVEEYLARFLENAGSYRVRAALEKSRELVKRNPLFWSQYTARTAHEGGADAMAAETAVRIAEGRHATRRDLDRLTAFRPSTVREYLKVRMGGRIGAQRPVKPSMFEKWSERIAFASDSLVNALAGLDRAAEPGKGVTPGKLKQRGLIPRYA